MPSAKSASMQSKAYDFIKRKITMCEYAPNQLLSEAVLQEELGRACSKYFPSAVSLFPASQSAISARSLRCAVLSNRMPCAITAPVWI